MFQICQILYFANAFRLDLVESFPTWEPYIEHSFGVWDTKSRALTTGQKQNSNSILWDLQQPCENMMSGQAGDKLAGNSNHNKMQLHVFYKRGRWSHCYILQVNFSLSLWFRLRLFLYFFSFVTLNLLFFLLWLMDFTPSQQLRHSRLFCWK